MKRAILLQTLATRSKNRRLNDFTAKALREYNRMLSAKWNPETCDWVDTFMDFHNKTLSVSKINTSFNVQVRCSLIRDAWKKKGQKADGLTVKFNVPRNCKTFSTKVNFFIELGMYPRRRVAVPIKQNSSYQRFASLIVGGWICKTYGLTSDGQVVAYLNKEKEIIHRKNVLGIDVNAKPYAVSVLSPNGKVLYQTYFGKHIWARRKKLMQRKAFLQAIGKKKSLMKIGRYQRNFVKTNLGQMIAEIIKIAKRFDADIAIENLKRFNPKGREYNRNVLHIPFLLFRSILGQRCFDNDIHLNIISSRNTSRWCSHCGALGNGHESSNYSLFRCKVCGQVVNSDRKASLSVAVKSLLERNKHISNQVASFQFSSRRVPVNGLLCSDEVGLKYAVHDIQPSEGKPTCFSCG